jgi:hypothetical protein
MANYYGYKERTDPTKSLINWSGITKTITDSLYAESERRDKEKFTLDENYIKQLNELNNYSQGLNPSVNQAMLGYVQNYRDYLLENHKMMKQGVISVNDSKIAKQGSLDSFNNLNNVVKGVNGKLEQLQKSGGALNDDQMKDLSQLLEFKDQQLLIDPKTGMASLAKRNEDGTVDKNSIVPVGAAYQMFTPYDQKSVNDMVSGEIKGIGQWTEASDAYRSISDLRDNPEYKNWETATIETLMSDQRTAASLGSSLGLLDSNELVKKNNGGIITYELTPDGETEVKDALRQAIQVRVDREVKMKESLFAKTTKVTTNQLSAQEVYNESIRLARFDRFAMDNLQGQVINSGTDANPDPRTIGNVDRNGNSLVIYDTEGNLIRQYNIDPNNENRSAEALALLIRPDAQSSDTQTLFTTGRDMGYTGGEIKESESGDYVSILETIPMDEDEFIRFLGNEPAFQNSNYKVEKPNSTDNKITIRTKQEEYIGTFKTDDPYQRKMLIKQLNELGLDFPDIKRPAGLTTSAERFPEQDNNTSSVTGGTSR